MGLGERMHLVELFQGGADTQGARYLGIGHARQNIGQLAFKLGEIEVAVAKAALDLGFYISLSGILTFKTAEDLREVAAYVPLDRLLIETDSPYLAPVPYRGKTNNPAYVPHVAACLATVKGVSVETVASQTSANFHTLFDKVPAPEPVLLN